MLFELRNLFFLRFKASRRMVIRMQVPLFFIKAVTQRNSYAKMGVGFDDDLFKEKLRRDTTDVEFFETFGGKMIIDGIEKPKILFQLVKGALQIGGSAYMIDIGGGAASSRVQSEGNIDLNFDAIQRADVEMENR